MPDPFAPRKPSRFPIYGPFVLLLVFIAAWSWAWFQARAEVARRMDQGVEALRAAGYEVSWARRDLGGYPFRLDVTLTAPRIRDRSGWALSAPRLEGEAFMHAPTNWMIAAPQGLTFVRPLGGPVTVSGRLVRMSLSHLTNHPPNVSFEGTGLTFTTPAGARPFGLSTAERVEFHLRQAPAEVGDEAGVWLSVEQGKAQLSGLLGRIAGDKPISIQWDGRVSQASAFAGRSWADAVRHWRAAGGRMAVKRGALTAGDALIEANGGSLGAGDDGRIEGALDVSLRQAPRALGEIGATGALPADRAEAAAAEARARQGDGDIARSTLTFEHGRARLGAAEISPALRIY